MKLVQLAKSPYCTQTFYCEEYIENDRSLSLFLDGELVFKCHDIDWFFVEEIPEIKSDAYTYYNVYFNHYLDEWLSIRTINILNANGIYSTTQLAVLSEQQVSEMKGAGKTTVDECRKFLKHIELDFETNFTEIDRWIEIRKPQAQNWACAMRLQESKK